MKILNDKLAVALSECKAKDELVKKQTKIAQEAVAGNLSMTLCFYAFHAFCNCCCENFLTMQQIFLSII